MRFALAIRTPTKNRDDSSAGSNQLGARRMDFNLAVAFTPTLSRFKAGSINPFRQTF